jgi:hypothetical protein
MKICLSSHADMRDSACPHLLPPASTRKALVLRLEDGSPWRVTFSAGIERFIGCYPRLPEMRSEGPLLEFSAAAATA